MRRVAAVVGSGLLVAACSTSVPSTPPSSIVAAPSSTRSSAPATAAPGPTSRPTPTPVPVAGCPPGSPLTVREYLEADPACFDGANVTVRAWLDLPPPIGFEPPVIEPAWLYFPASNAPTLFNGRPTNPDHVCGDMAPECPWFFIHIDPASGLAIELRPRWILATGHRQDPAAATCHWVDPDGLTGPLPDDASAVESCRDSFVLVAIDDAP